jgi:cytochrome c oxidase assembly factor CtaG/ferredoxin
MWPSFGVNTVDSVASAALLSWRLDASTVTILLIAAFVYIRGWTRGRRLLQDERDHARLAAFLGGLAVLFVATDSPLDTFDRLLLSAHMTQHLLLLMIAPPLLLLGHPVVPLLRGLPKSFVKEGLGPFLTWPALKRFMKWLLAPPVAWVAFAVSTIFWHLPKFYELALSSPAWHGAQHATFFWTGILFWWPVVRPGPGKSRLPEWLPIPYLLGADILNTALSAFFVFSGRLLYPVYASAQLGAISAQEDQILAGAIMWVPGSVIYLVPTVVFTMRLLSGRSAQSGRGVLVRRVRETKPRRSWIDARLPLIRRVSQFAMLALALAVMADGFFGPQVAPLNLAGTLPWIHWRALSIAALLTIGNLFCMACPFTLVRDLARRVRPATRRWPRLLRTKWLAAGLLILYLWAYEAFGLWDSPWLTAWIIVGYFGAALTIDCIFRGASFCKYVCPIGQFHFVTSLVSPREVRVRKPEVCKTCRTHDCIRGNEKARGCELYLFQPKKAGNLDCTFCLDCVKACPHDNVALLPTMPAGTIIADPYRSSVGRLSKRTDLAALALLIVFGAFVNAAGMTGPVMSWEHGWHMRLGTHMMQLIVAGFVVAGVIVAPAIAVLLCGASAARRLVFALVPVGTAMWAAHLLYHVVPLWSALAPAQILLLDAGLLLTLYVAWRIGKTLAVAVPWMALACGLYAAGIWILFQPMPMRGMVH